MKYATYIAGLIGLAITTALVVHEGLDSVLKVLGMAGWGLLWLVPFHVLPLWLDTVAWRILLAPRDPEVRAPTWYLFWTATIREGANRLLPVANVGGEIIGIRLVVLRGLNGAAVTASVLIEVLLTVLNQYVFTALGLVLLITATQATELTSTILIGLALSLPIPILIFVVLRYGSVFQRIERGIERMLGKDVAGVLAGADLDAEVQALVKRKGRMLHALVWQLACYVLGSFEVWFAMRLLGHPVSGWAAVAIEAVTQAVRHFIFFVPAGLGVQEAGIVIFGQMLGINHDVALSLSLAKRMRELVFGTPALLSWQFVEGRRLRRRLREEAAGDARS